MDDILILKDQYFQIEGTTKAIATINQYLAKNVCFSVSRENMTKGLWKKLRDLYEKETTSNNVLFMMKLYNIRMGGPSAAKKLNEFNIINS